MNLFHVFKPYLRTHFNTILPGGSYLSASPAIISIGYCRHRFMRHLVYSVRYSVVPINFSLSTITLFSLVITTLVYNYTKYSVPFMTLCAGVATSYGLHGPGIESRWAVRFSAPVQTGPGTHPTSYTMGTGSLTQIKRLGRAASHRTPF
jgi:hypothetical protein